MAQQKRKLLTYLSATNIVRASPSSNNSYGPVSSGDQTIAITIMHVLNRIISSDTASYQTRTKACFILCERHVV